MRTMSRPARPLPIEGSLGHTRLILVWFRVRRLRPSAHVEPEHGCPASCIATHTPTAARADVIMARRVHKEARLYRATLGER